MRLDFVLYFFFVLFSIRSDLLCFLLFYRAWIVNLKLSDIVYIVKPPSYLLNLSRLGRGGCKY